MGCSGESTVEVSRRVFPWCHGVVCAAFESLGLNGDELMDIVLKTLQKRLAKSGADDATVLAKQVLEQRGALTSDDSAAKVNDQPLCKI